MSDDAKESKAKKLAAARKKLKEYQMRNSEPSASSAIASGMSTSTTSVASSEKSDIEICRTETSYPTASSFFNASNKETAFDQVFEEQEIQRQHHVPVENYFESSNETSIQDNFSSDSNGQQQHHQQHQQEQIQQEEQDLEHHHHHQQQQRQEELDQYQQHQHLQHINAMQLLINEKSQLTMELNRYRNTFIEQNSELEELRSEVNASRQHIEELQQTCGKYKQNQEQISKQNAELMHKLSQANANQEDQSAHVTELQQQLRLIQNQLNELDEKYREKCKEYELAQLRIQQISNETQQGSNDNRVETLTQNQFMYEQQIHDLQAMVQQFSQDKEQSSMQYQNYVQHLNSEVVTLRDRNSELNDECTRLQERERELIEHISELERELQKQLSQRQTLSETQTQTQTQTQTPIGQNESQPSNDDINLLHKQIEQYEERMNELEFERHEFQLKIKSQEDRLEELKQNLSAKEEELSRIADRIVEQPDQLKLLATMESDKIAASRALTQNVELKKQLDELELRFVQLTNDKAELTNKLDAEEFSNREMRKNYANLELRVQSMDERFQFKDEEMIRLSHENEELIQEKSLLEKQLNELKEGIEESNPSSHEEAHYHKNDSSECNGESEHSRLIENHNSTCCSESDSCEEAHEIQMELKKKSSSASATTQIATTEAVEKLQERFTYLMTQIADLTEEKQRLEHLVLQLQGETETIGEYIALYQTQRRILKQREYEKAAQARLLQEEREILREKIGKLNQLVTRLGLLDKNATKKHQNEEQERNEEDKEGDEKQNRFNNLIAESMSIEHQNHDNMANETIRNDFQDLNYNNKTQEIFDIPETNEILMKIQTIVSEIRENTSKELPSMPVDHCHCCEGQLKVV